MRVSRMSYLARRMGGLRRQDGFTMVAAMVTMLIASVLVAAALSAASDDAGLAQNDLNQKQAFLAARAGISDFQFHLNQDPNYWSYCTNVPSPSAVNQAGSTTNRMTMPGNSGATYAIELLPATGQSQCLTSSPVTSMVEQTGSAAGTFRIRSTGYSHGVQRSIVATFRRKSFLDFVYYTKYETLDPSAYQSASDRTAAAAQCDVYYRNGRPTPATSGQNYCVQIFFTSNDVVNGPLHTEDELAICGNPVFGRNSNDRIEIVAPAPGHSNQGNGGCADNPTFKGQLVTGAGTLEPPPTNAQLKQLAASQYQFTGQTDIVLGSNNITVNTLGNPSQTLPYPSNGVLYVSSSSCSTTYTPFGVTYTTVSPTWAYSGGSGCGTVTVHGTVGQSLTIASDNDVMVDGNITTSNGNLLGLIAQNYVRIFHPMTGSTNSTCPAGQTNLTGSSTTPNSLNGPTVDAAMLALTGSFIVDNYNCGAQLGNLNVTGSIGQIYRGPVGLIGSAGYLKNYTYDDNLRDVEPPHFIEPVQAAWHVIRETECSVSSSAPC